jgi:hypothetical protein
LKLIKAVKQVFAMYKADKEKEIQDLRDEMEALKQKHLKELQDNANEIIKEYKDKMSKMTFTFRLSPSALEDKWTSLVKSHFKDVVQFPSQYMATVA